MWPFRKSVLGVSGPTCFFCPGPPTLGNRSGRGYTPEKMFTGIVENTGVLAARAARGEGARLSITTPLGPLVVGESIAVHGACLTVQTVTTHGFECDATVETLACTTL